MGKRSSFYAEWTTEERVEQAWHRLERLRSEFTDAIHLRQHIDCICYCEDIRRNFFGTTGVEPFVYIEQSLIFSMIAKLTAMWDESSKDRCSIPTIIDLITGNETKLSEEISDLIQKKIDQRFQEIAAEQKVDLNDLSAPARDYFNAIRRQKNMERIKLISSLNDQSKIITESEQMQRLRAFRNNNLSHNLKGEGLKVIRSFNLYYQDEKIIFEKTQKFLRELIFQLGDEHTDIFCEYQSSVFDETHNWWSRLINTNYRGHSEPTNDRYDW